MRQPVFKPKYLAIARCVFSFRRDMDIRLKQGQAERALRSTFANQSEQTNVPDTLSPEAPRFVFSEGKKSLKFSQVAADLEMDLEDFKANVDGALSVIEKNCNAVETALSSIVDTSQINNKGVIFTVNFPSDDDDVDLKRYIFRRFLNLTDPTGNVVEANVGFGYRHNEEMNELYHISGYETRSVTISSTPGIPMPSVINLKDFPLVDHGIEVKVDLNWRPAITRSAPTDTKIKGLIVRFKEIWRDLDNLMAVKEPGQ